MTDGQVRGLVSTAKRGKRLRIHTIRFVLTIIRVELCPGDYVTISASRFPFPSVLPLGRGSEDWIDSLSQTLDWNSRQRQKPYKD